MAVAPPTAVANHRSPVAAHHSPDVDHYVAEGADSDGRHLHEVSNSTRGGRELERRHNRSNDHRGHVPRLNRRAVANASQSQSALAAAM
jgi:hypothetical protein